MKKLKNYIKEKLKKSKTKKYFNSIILLYHRVIDLKKDPQLLSVSINNFKEQMHILQQVTNALPLQELPQYLKSGNLPDKSVFITFDDGYADNLYNAKPILEKYDIPATIFITTGVSGKNYEFWWDKLASILLVPGELQKKIILKVNKKTFEWDLGKYSNYTKNQSIKDAYWNVTDDSYPTIRHKVYKELCIIFRTLDHNTIEKVIQQLKCEIKKNEKRSNFNRILTKKEIRTLDNSPLIEVGAHTVNHSVLSRLNKKNQKIEIYNSKIYLENLTGKSIHSFSYPYGSESDYNHQTMKILKSTGFKLSCSNFPDRISNETDLLQLPRFIARNWNGDKFYSFIAKWLG